MVDRFWKWAARRDWDLILSCVAVGTLTIAWIGRSLRGETVWPEIVGIAGFAILAFGFQVHRILKRRRDPEQVLDDVQRAVRGVIQPGTGYIAILVGPDRCGEGHVATRIAANMNEEGVRYFLSFIYENQIEVEHHVH